MLPESGHRCSMKIARVALATGLFLMGCSPEHEEQRWRSRGATTSPYSATLTKTDYNKGESNAYQLRVDADAHGDGG